MDIFKKPLDDDKMNKHKKSILDDYIDAADTDTKDFDDISHNPKAKKVNNSQLVTDIDIFEAGEEAVQEKPVDEEDMNLEDQKISEPVSASDNNDLLSELNKIFTPVLVTQKFEQDISDKANNELNEAGALTEKSIISFDEPTRMAQLVSICALLIAKKKNTPNWQTYKRASTMARQSKLDIQKEEYQEAQTLAQKYLVMVSTTNNSSIARDAANELLPETQH